MDFELVRIQTVQKFIHYVPNSSLLLFAPLGSCMLAMQIGPYHSTRFQIESTWTPLGAYELALWSLNLFPGACWMVESSLAVITDPVDRLLITS